MLNSGQPARYLRSRVEATGEAVRMKGGGVEASLVPDALCAAHMKKRRSDKTSIEWGGHHSDPKRTYEYSDVIRGIDVS